MFDLNPNQSQFYGFFNRSNSLGDHTSLVYRAVRLFNNALSRGHFARLTRSITRKPGKLLDLNTMHTSQVKGQYYAGVRAIELKKIRGSLGRTGDFDCDFNPLDSRLRDRWQSIAIACLHNTGLKPVELIQLDDCYFVKDGHHRISVARAMGKCAIDAEVTVWVVPQKMPRNLSQYDEPPIQTLQILS